MSLPIRRVPEHEIRRIFNDGGIYEARLRNDLLEVVESERLAHAAYGQPEGTISRLSWYFTPQLERVALVHQFIRPDGTLGASGRPDPKWLLVDGVILKPER